MVSGSPSPVARPISDKMTAKMIHPTRSLKTAAAMIIMPRSLRYRARSMSVRAITGRAEMLHAVAKNRAKMVGSAPG